MADGCTELEKTAGQFEQIEKVVTDKFQSEPSQSEEDKVILIGIKTVFIFIGTHINEFFKEQTMKGSGADLIGVKGDFISQGWEICPPPL